jgi:hypothetical protein
MATQFTRQIIERAKGDAGSTFWRWLWSYLLAWVNAIDDRVDAVASNMLQAITRHINEEGGSGSGYLSGKTFRFMLHVCMNTFNCFGATIMGDYLDGSVGITSNVYVRIGYVDPETFENVFPNENYVLLDPNAPVNYIPILASDPGVYESTPIPEMAVLFLEVTLGNGEEINAMVELLGTNEGVPLPLR